MGEGEAREQRGEGQQRGGLGRRDPARARALHGGGVYPRSGRRGTLGAMTALGFLAFDADNHYYEAVDAFTRHIEPALAQARMQWAEIDGKRRLLVGGKVNRFIPNPTFDPVARPGCLDDYYQGKNPEGTTIRDAFGELDADPPRLPRPRGAPEGDGRTRACERRVLLPDARRRHGGGAEATSPRRWSRAFRAFNRWLDDDWGFAYRERIFAAPYSPWSIPSRRRRARVGARPADARAARACAPAPVRAPGRQPLARATRTSTPSGRA